MGTFCVRNRSGLVDWHFTSIRVAARSQLLAIRNILASIYEGSFRVHVCIIS